MFKVNLQGKHVEKSPEEVEGHIRSPKYFSPSEAVEYGIVDKVPQLERAHNNSLLFCSHSNTMFLNFLQVLYNGRSTEDRGVVSNLKKALLI